MIKNIEYSKPYKLQLLPLYGAKDYNCFVIGETNIDNVANNQDQYNIYETYFAPLGYGLGSYYAAITEKTRIFICNEITSFEPLNVERDKKIFIPESLINKNESYEYVECGNISFTIYPVIKLFDSIDSQEKFLNELKDKMRKKLGELIEFSILSNEIESYVEPLYLTREEITDIENRRSAMYKKHIDTQESLIKFKDVKDHQYNELISKLRHTIDENIRKSDDLAATKLNLERVIQEYEALIRNLTDQQTRSPAPKPTEPEEGE